MKLRNKTTKEVWNIPEWRTPAVQEGDICFFAELNGEGKLFSYKSLDDLNKEWEDYTPAEPLIKDEKIRKAVRAWAEVLEVNEVESYGSRDWIGLLAKYDWSDWSSKFELDCYGSENTLVSDKKYTIAELCGEEEE